LKEFGRQKAKMDGGGGVAKAESKEREGEGFAQFFLLPYGFSK
jgi:hypothetical protein